MTGELLSPVGLCIDFGSSGIEDATAVFELGLYLRDFKDVTAYKAGWTNGNLERCEICAKTGDDWMVADLSRHVDLSS